MRLGKSSIASALGVFFSLHPIPLSNIFCLRYLVFAPAGLAIWPILSRTGKTELGREGVSTSEHLGEFKFIQIFGSSVVYRKEHFTFFIFYADFKNGPRGENHLRKRT
ncbi:hypothetical protein TNIN_183351 [Trichonephila inaurata madagascariensis]|uniref:Uncharacterized protein n=1 Tax=Trichonephila inaurata madagascariensis TaxID=2747483 RepID=A0A8X6K2A9_9ARAC|nr:hypothetical protein TNIN_183351 [Trichonephila inaurata madagascariensis]